MNEPPPPCDHEGVVWRKGKYESNGKHGPEFTITVVKERLRREWALCSKCGLRLERATVVK